jgi:hypothetical protein
VSSARTLAALVLTAALLVGGCERSPKIVKPSKAFCDAAANYEERITAKKPPSVAEQVQLVEKMAVTAPKDIKADAATFLDAMRKVASGDASVRNDPAVKQAVTDVNRHYAQGCGLYTRKGPL